MVDFDTSGDSFGRDVLKKCIFETTENPASFFQAQTGCFLFVLSDLNTINWRVFYIVSENCGFGGSARNPDSVDYIERVPAFEKQVEFEFLLEGEEELVGLQAKYVESRATVYKQVGHLDLDL